MRVVIGNGLSAFVIGSCLKYLNEDFVIIDNFNKYKPILPPIALLRIDNIQEKKLYCDIFKTNNSSIKKIKLGYLFNNKIYNTPTEEMKRNYFEKQNRVINASSMSDGLNSYYAIDLSLIFSSIKEYLKNNISTTMIKGDIIYDTTPFLKDDNYSYEFIKSNNYEVSCPSKYSYVYDCNKFSSIKRFSRNNIELLHEFKDSIKIKNYYEPFRVIIEENESQKIIHIGRIATHTQTKQKDIINYILGETPYEI